MASVLDELVEMSRRLADPRNDYVILGEGNTSARADDHSFWVKSSGAKMAQIVASNFVRVRFEPILAMLDGPPLSDDAVKESLGAARADPGVRAWPSVETMLHAVLLSRAGATTVGHTHPIAVNMILCSQNAEEAFSGRIFPEEIVVCGEAPLLVPYADPGLPLARGVDEGVRGYVESYGEPPKVIMMRNHGLLALGSSPREVEAITEMAVKTARVLLGTYAMGGPRCLTPEAVRRIHTRPDEDRRRSKLGR